MTLGDAHTAQQGFATVVATLATTGVLPPWLLAVIWVGGPGPV